MAEKMNTTGMSGVDHHGFALIEPKMKPTYPWSRNAEGMPISVMTQPSRSSSSSACLADVARAQGHQSVDQALPSGGGLR
jgi:hypothetical protein